MSTGPKTGTAAGTNQELSDQIRKLAKINAVLMDRVERSVDRQGSAFALFQTAIALEAQVRARTKELTQVLSSLEQTNAQLSAAKEDAEKANLSKTRFLAAASHDLLQPVISAKLSISTLADLQENQEGRRLAQLVEGSLQTIEDLIRTLLDISKLDAGVIVPEVRTFPLDVLLADLHATFESAMASAEIRLKVRRCGLLVESDPVLLWRVILNLVSNAIHYTKRGGVLVGVRRRGAFCHLDVVDTGAGISECEQQRIFDEFYRGASSARGNRAGLGLGLSIVQRITQTLGHELSLKSAHGRGSRFRVALPVAGTATGLPSPSLSTLSDLSGVCVLIVENDPPVAKAMQRLFEQWGCQTLVAYGLTDVDRHLRTIERLPDIIVADYHLDGNDVGIAAIEAVRAILPGVPALVVTADHSPETSKAVRASQAMLLHKPVPPGRLRASVSHLLAKARRE
jgi:signal transduction histidine kinase/CheY-like chemotaxis protein